MSERFPDIPTRRGIAASPSSTSAGAVRRAPAPESEGATCSPGDPSCAAALAGDPRRAALGNGVMLQRSLQRLQRDYGNQFVGRVLRQARDGLPVGTSAERNERSADRVSDDAFPQAVASPAPLGLFRQAGGGAAALTDVTVNQDRVTVPPSAGLSFRAAKVPANASGVTISLVGDGGTAISPGTTVNNATGAITVAAAQTGGSAHVEAKQTITGPGGATTVTTASAPFNFTAIPSGISSTTASRSGTAGAYGGDFTHTFSSPAGGQAALERAHVNEQFPGASGTTLLLKGTLGSLSIAVNNPSSATAGWDLDSSGTMAGPDAVGWSDTMDARPFVANASNPSPNPGLPQELTATQNFRNLAFPSQVYGTTAVATPTHRRAIEERSSRLKAVTSANAKEIVEDYAGPTVFRRCRAAPASIPVAAIAPPGATPRPAATSTISVDAEGQSAAPTFSIRPPDLGCTISSGGVLTAGNTPGTITIRAGDTNHFDEATITLKP